MSDKTILFDIKLENKDAKKNSADLTAEIARLTNEQKKLNKTLKDSNGTNKEAAASLSETNRELKDNRKKLSENNKTIAKNTDLQNANNGSLTQLELSIARNNKAYKNLSKSERENSAAGIELGEALAAQRDELNKSKQAVNDNTSNIGNYKESIHEAVSELGGMSGMLDSNVSFQDKFNKLITVGGKSFKGMSAGISTSSKALKIFKMALIATGIGAIVVLIGSLIAALSSSQKVVDKVSQALAVLRAAYDVVAGNIASLLGLNDEATKSFSDMAKEIKRAGEEAASIANLKKELIGLNNEAKRSIATLEKEADIFAAIAGDSTRSFKELEEANTKELKAREEANKIKIKLAEKEFEVIKRENDLRRKQGVLKDEEATAEAEAQAAYINAQKDAQVEFINIEKERRQIIQDRLEKDLDILIDGFDNVKTINEKIIANEKVSASVREALLNKTAKLASDSFKKQIDTIQQFTDFQIDSNDLINESDAIVLNNKIRALGLSEIIEGRLLEIIRERRIALSDLGEAEADLMDERNDGLEESLAEENEIKKAAELDYRAWLRALNEEETKFLEEYDNEQKNKQIEVDKETQLELDKLDAAELKKYDDKAKAKIKLDKLVADTKVLREQATQELINKIFKKDSAAYKVFASAKAVINTYLGATDVLKDPMLPSFLKISTAVAIIANGLASVAQINGVKFAKGGMVNVEQGSGIGSPSGLVSGASHSQGGIQMYHKSGSHLGEMEGGEFIVNKYDTAKNLPELKRINSGSGETLNTPIYAAAGGRVPYPQQGSGVESLQLIKAMNDRIDRFEVVQNTNDLASALADNIEVKQAGSLIG